MLAVLSCERREVVAGSLRDWEMFCQSDGLHESRKNYKEVSGSFRDGEPLNRMEFFDENNRVRAEWIKWIYNKLWIISSRNKITILHMQSLALQYWQKIISKYDWLDEVRSLTTKWDRSSVSDFLLKRVFVKLSSNSLTVRLEFSANYLTQVRR